MTDDEIRARKAIAILNRYLPNGGRWVVYANGDVGERKRWSARLRDWCDDQFPAPFLLLFLVILIGGAVQVFALGGAAGQAIERRDAVEAGVGRWTVDAGTGQPRFEYISPHKDTP